MCDWPLVSSTSDTGNGAICLAYLRGKLKKKKVEQSLGMKRTKFDFELGIEKKQLVGIGFVEPRIVVLSFCVLCIFHCTKYEGR